VPNFLLQPRRWKASPSPFSMQLTFRRSPLSRTATNGIPHAKTIPPLFPLSPPQSWRTGRFDSPFSFHYHSPVHGSRRFLFFFFTPHNIVTGTSFLFSPFLSFFQTGALHGASYNSQCHLSFLVRRKCRNKGPFFPLGARTRAPLTGERGKGRHLPFFWHDLFPYRKSE